MDGFEGKTKKPKYDYPFASTPEPGTVQPIAEGVYWVRMPLPFALEWINLWLLEDGDGWTIVDTGIATEITRDHWRSIFDTVLDGRPVKRVIVTHMHPDHVGLAGWICRKFDAPLWMSRLEYMTCRTLVADTGRDAPEEAIDFYRRLGWGEELIATYKKKFGGFGRSVSRLPDSYKRIRDGDQITIGDNEWTVVTGAGHCPEHVCLFCEALNLFISGDQLLPKISSNVSVFPTEPDANPLDEWMRSCERLISVLPEDVLVLPAHNEPFYGAHRRLRALIQGHEVGLRRLKDRLREPRKVADLFVALFARKISDDVVSMATGETLAHLNYLIELGDVRAVQSNDGITRFVAT